MFGHRYFGARYFGPRYWGPAAAGAGGDCPTVGQIWAYVMSNGNTAEQNLVQTNTMLATLTGAVEGSLTLLDLVRIIAAVSAGKSTIVDNGNSTATVEFQAVDGTDVRVSAEMDGSERTSVTITPEST